MKLVHASNSLQRINLHQHTLCCGEIETFSYTTCSWVCVHAGVSVALAFQEGLPHRGPALPWSPVMKGGWRGWRRRSQHSFHGRRRLRTWLYHCRNCRERDVLIWRAHAVKQQEPRSEKRLKLFSCHSCSGAVGRQSLNADHDDVKNLNYK